MIEILPIELHDILLVIAIWILWNQAWSDKRFLRNLRDVPHRMKGKGKR